MRSPIRSSTRIKQKQTTTREDRYGTMDQRLNDEERELELERQELLRVLIADAQRALEESMRLTGSPT